jgi:hypothetical protein
LVTLAGDRPGESSRVIKLVPHALARVGRLRWRDAAMKTLVRRIRIVKRQAGALQNVTSALGYGDRAIAPALSMIGRARS